MWRLRHGFACPCAVWADHCIAFALITNVKQWALLWQPKPGLRMGSSWSGQAFSQINPLQKVPFGLHTALSWTTQPLLTLMIIKCHKFRCLSFKSCNCRAARTPAAFGLTPVPILMPKSAASLSETAAIKYVVHKLWMISMLALQL